MKLLQLMVKCAKRKHCELGVVFVDIAKAFYTVCHQHIITGLVQRGVDPHVIHLVTEWYKNITTYIGTKSLKTQEEKCYGFYMKPTRDSYTINDSPAWTINGSPLNMIDPGSSEKYLGIRIDPWIGFAD
ncbi:hypothetical protein TURU_021414 [Turdus rufiventris]|nr:hypothetical protein TURU_021414 [Turdus rufiventris]